MPDAQEFPLITVGIAVFNREWIIKHMLASLQRQNYPHDKLFVLIVDGVSKDNTIKFAKEVLAKSDFGGYEIIIKDTNIPEARNLCIEHLRGDFLLFWDSDVIMEPAAVAGLLETLKEESADMVSSCVTEVLVNSTSELDKKWLEWETKYPHQDMSQVVGSAKVGNLLISKKVLTQMVFNPAYTVHEDQDFTTRATKLGFKIVETRRIIGFDVNSSQQYSDIYAFDMPIKRELRGIRNRGKVEAQNLTAGSSSASRTLMGFFWANKRCLFSIGYVPVIALTVAGVLLQNLWLSLVFPVYFLLFTFNQIIRKGFARGLSIALGSFVVGIPVNYSLIYYSIKQSFQKPKR